MMILAIDTSTRVSSVALVEDGRVVAELNQDTRLTHSERLMPQIKQLLDIAEKTTRDLSAIAVSIGPGSFTGLRIGMATAKTMAYALGIPVVGVPTLDALAWNCPLDGVHLVPMLDAQKGNVYTARYRFAGGEMIVEEGAVVTRALIADGVKIGKGAVVGSADSEEILLVAKDVEGVQ